MAFRVTKKNVKNVLWGLKISGLDRDYVDYVHKELNIQEGDVDDWEDDMTKAEKDYEIEQVIFFKLMEKAENGRLCI